MVIAGTWWTCDDGVSRPIIRVGVEAGNGQVLAIRFLVDTGADRSAFDAALLKQLHVAQQPPPSGLSLEGVGGASPFVIVETVLQLPREDGGIASIKGQFAAFTDRQAVDLSILGRDVLQHFDVVVSRRRNQVLLLTAGHDYTIKST